MPFLEFPVCDKSMKYARMYLNLGAWMGWDSWICFMCEYCESCGGVVLAHGWVFKSTVCLDLLERKGRPSEQEDSK